MNAAATSPPIVRGVVSRLHQAMTVVLRGSPRVSVLYSGGLDSSLVASVAGEISSVELVTVGVRGSPDLTAAERGARALDLAWTDRTIERSDIERVLRSDNSLLADANRASRAVLVGLALALEVASHPRVLCGQGADELFLGYAHFEGLSAADTRRKQQEDLDRLLGSDWPRSVRLAQTRGKDLRSPYLEPEFLSHARGISIDQLRWGGGRKPLLREVAVEVGVPSELVARPKKAFQYGSGIERLMRSLPMPGEAGA